MNDSQMAQQAISLAQTADHNAQRALAQIAELREEIAHPKFDIDKFAAAIAKALDDIDLSIHTTNDTEEN